MVVVVGGARVAEVVREDEAGEAAEAEGEDSRRRTLIAQSLRSQKNSRGGQAMYECCLISTKGSGKPRDRGFHGYRKA